jgi:hypothetical protein
MEPMFEPAFSSVPSSISGPTPVRLTAMQTPANKRAAERKPMSLAARLMWKDQRGTQRFATVVTRDVSEFGVYVETQTVVSIPLYRIVQFQLERETDADGLPQSLRQGRILSAVYRVSPPSRGGTRQGFALRLMVDPKRRGVDTRHAISA